MRTNKLAVRIAATAFFLIGMLTGGSAVSADESTATSQKLDNATCLTCHDGEKSKLEVPTADGEKRELFVIKPDKYAGSVHAKLTCVSCHTDIIDSQANHQRAVGAKPLLDCVQCHENLWEVAQEEKQTAEHPRLGVVIDNIAAWKKSIHARHNADDPTKYNAVCNDCHNVHTFDVPPRGSTERKEWHLTIPSICGSCHEDELDEWTESIHGKEVTEKHNVKAAVCSDCHTTHDIVNSSSDQAKLLITANCGNCHQENFASYKASYHGQVNTLGYTYTAKCYDCHGSHGILPPKDPASTVNPKNRLKTCQKCHNGKKPGVPPATAGFISFSPHGNSHDFANYPEIWLTTKFMLALLIGVFTFFWAHSILWWYREYKDIKDGRAAPYIRTTALPPEFRIKEEQIEKSNLHVRRFGPMWRLAHLCFALSVMLLILTGMAVYFSETSWAKTVMVILGGPKIAGLIHRCAAATMLSIFFIHLIVVCTKLARNWRNFKFFGPDSLVPTWKDKDDIIAMFKWFVGKGPRPKLERWSYWEKFDYWAVFWGMAIIGSSGMTLAFPHVVATYLPGWIFNVAMVVHGEEALLAAVFLFTVHFFNNHFRPDKMPPPDVVMFTGTQSLEEFKHEHTAQYLRLLESGELEKYLVKPPSPLFTFGSKILGLILIGFGLTLLVLIAIGFFGAHL